MTETIVNRDQAEAWDGPQGAHWAAHAARYNASIAAYDDPLLAAADLRRGDAVLDIGCGCGFTTRAAARQVPAGHARGVDLSRPMLRVAAALAAEEGIANVTFDRADAQVEPFAPVDVVISRFGAMFFADMGDALANIGAAVRPGGRIALVGWTDLARNEWLRVVRDTVGAGRDLPVPPVGGPGPFGLGDPDRTRRWLEAAGFSAVEIDEVTRPFVAGVDADDAFSFHATTQPVQALLEGLDAAARAAALDRFRAALAERARPGGVVLGSSAWLVAAVKR